MSCHQGSAIGDLIEAEGAAGEARAAILIAVARCCFEKNLKNNLSLFHRCVNV
jgi:hypothetical protein